MLVRLPSPFAARAKQTTTQKQAKATTKLLRRGNRTDDSKKTPLPFLSLVSAPKSFSRERKGVAANVNIPNIRLYISVFFSFPTSSNLLTVSLHCGMRETKFEVVGLLRSSRTSRTKSRAEMRPGILERGLTLSSSLSHSGNMGTHMLFVHLLSQRERGWRKAFFISRPTPRPTLTSVLYVKHSAVTLFLPTEVTHSSANSSFNSKPILKTHVCLEYVPKRGWNVTHSSPYFHSGCAANTED